MTVAWSHLAAVDKERRGQVWGIFWALVMEVMGAGVGKRRETLRLGEGGSEVWSLLLAQAWQGEVPLIEAGKGMWGKERQSWLEEALG